MNVQFAVKDEEVYVLEVNPEHRVPRRSLARRSACRSPNWHRRLWPAKRCRKLGFTREVIRTIIPLKKWSFLHFYFRH